MDRVALVCCLSDALADAAQRLTRDWPSVDPVIDTGRMTVVHSNVLWDQIRSGTVALQTLIGTIAEVEESGEYVGLLIRDGEREKEISFRSAGTGMPRIGDGAALRYVEKPFSPASALAGRVATSVVELWLTERSG